MFRKTNNTLLSRTRTEPEIHRSSSFCFTTFVLLFYNTRPSVLRHRRTPCWPTSTTLFLLFGFLLLFVCFCCFCCLELCRQCFELEDKICGKAMFLSLYRLQNREEYKIKPPPPTTTTTTTTTILHPQPASIPPPTAPNKKKERKKDRKKERKVQQSLYLSLGLCFWM